MTSLLQNVLLQMVLLKRMDLLKYSHLKLEVTINNTVNHYDKIKPYEINILLKNLNIE